MTPTMLPQVLDTEQHLIASLLHMTPTNALTAIESIRMDTLSPNAVIIANAIREHATDHRDDTVPLSPVIIQDILMRQGNFPDSDTGIREMFLQVVTNMSMTTAHHFPALKRGLEDKHFRATFIEVGTQWAQINPDDHAIDELDTIIRRFTDQLRTARGYPPPAPKQPVTRISDRKTA